MLYLQYFRDDWYHNLKCYTYSTSCTLTDFIDSLQTDIVDDKQTNVNNL